MRNCVALAITLLLTTACGSRDDGAQENMSAADKSGANAAVDPVAEATDSATSGDAPADGDAIRQNAKSAGKEPVAPQPIAAVEKDLPQSPADGGDPCMTQDGRPLRVAPLRATGTEPFWSARVQGRCVTYSNPEDQGGTRIWTRHRSARAGGSWSGVLAGRRFELRVRPDPGCSDGMSDRQYPLAADLRLGDERRSGCAEPH